MQVKIRNFQSINEVDFEVKGLTVITGPNNTGKSACARAVAGAFSNPRGHSYVRQGEKYSSVQITFSDGNDLTWEKGKGVNRYQINGKVIDKVGTSVPDEVKALNVTSVDVDGKEIYPQIARQFEQVFLLDMPPSVLSSALSDVDLIKTLESATSLARGDVRSLKGRLKVKREDLELERQNLPNFEGVDQADVLVSDIYKIEVEIEKITSQLQQVEKDFDERTKLMLEIKNLQQAELIVFPKVDLSRINQIKELQDIKKQTTKLKIMEMMIGVGMESFPTLPNPDSIKDPSNLEKVLAKRTQLSETISTLSEIDIQLPDIPTGLDETINLSQQRLDLAKKIKIAENQVQTLSDELHKLKDQIGETCPLCDQGVNH